MNKPSWSRVHMQQEVLKFLQNYGTKAFRAKEIARRLGLRGRADYVLCRDVLTELVKQGRVAATKGNRFAHRPAHARTEGLLRVHPNGFGFEVTAPLGVVR